MVPTAKLKTVKKHVNTKKSWHKQTDPNSEKNTQKHINSKPTPIPIALLLGKGCPSIGAGADMVLCQSMGYWVTNTAVSRHYFSPGSQLPIRALTPFGWYQIILLGDRGTCMCEHLGQSCYMNVEQLGGELLDSKANVITGTPPHQTHHQPWL